MTMRTPLFLSLLIIAAAFALALPGFADDKHEHAPAKAPSKPPAKYPYKAAATVAMVADIVAGVAGEKAKVTGIIGTGVDPHLYKPTTSDVRILTDADVVFYSGLHLEGKMGEVLEKTAKKKPTFAVTARLDPKYIVHPEEGGAPDPHVWMDLSAWAKATEQVRDDLSEYDPANAAQYKANAQKLMEQMLALDAYGKKIMASVPKETRVLITSHDAFNYFGRAYNLEVMGIQGISTESEAGLSDINKLVDTLVKRKIKAVFVESSVSPKNIKALIEGAKARGHEVIIGGELFSDAMGQEGTYEGTYLGMLDHNLTTVARALGGEAPEKGFAGKLGEKSGKK
jgi:manganese/zinc/iron transport system substrate-binding protein